MIESVVPVCTHRLQVVLPSLTIDEMKIGHLVRESLVLWVRGRHAQVIQQLSALKGVTAVMPSLESSVSSREISNSIISDFCVGSLQQQSQHEITTGKEETE